MTDWAKLKVVDLKEACKSRNIPLTGLKLKQQYVDKLEEYETSSASAADTKDDIKPLTDTTAHEPNEPNQQQVSLPQIREGQPSSESEGKESISNVKDTSDHAKNDDLAPKEIPIGERGADPNAGGYESLAVQDEANPGGELDELGKTQLQTGLTGDLIQSQSAPQDMVVQPQSESPKVESNPEPTPASGIISDTSTPTYSQIPAGELAEDQRKRKRRSLTPVSSSEEMMRKRAKADNGNPVGTKQVPLEIAQFPQAEDSMKVIESSDQTVDEPIEEGHQPVPADEDTPVIPDEAILIADKPSASSKQQDTEESAVIATLEATRRSRSRGPSAELPIAPAVHPATSSIYIRNFKRPLHIPTLRSHVVAIANSRAGDDGSDPIKTFYLDSIRTHAYVSFNSISAASRVRSAMHGSRFPDEIMREPLFVDFIPDDKVQGWIDQESGGAGLGRGGGGGRRYEVVYTNDVRGIEATLQDVESGRERQQQLPIQNSRKSVDVPRVIASPSGVHPDRAGLVPREGPEDRMPQDVPSGPRKSVGTGFKALDELFSFTATKPKLYYKPVASPIVADRLGMIKDLRVSHAEIGRSGDEGMKRYSFEIYQGRDEWVDKGPEFGFGRKGQDRLVGFRGRGGGGGGYGSYRGGRGGDSWRGR